VTGGREEGVRVCGFAGSRNGWFENLISIYTYIHIYIYTHIWRVSNILVQCLLLLPAISSGILPELLQNTLGEHCSYDVRNLCVYQYVFWKRKTFSPVWCSNPGGTVHANSVTQIHARARVV
jgi:hypothetical protein